MSLLRLTRNLTVAAGLGLLLSACGFQPLYGPTSSGAQLTEAMKSVDIATIPGRVGQRIRNQLIFAAQDGGGNDGIARRYRLEIAVKEELRNTLVATTGKAQGRIVELNAEFRLINLVDNKPVFSGKTAGRAAFDTGVTDASNSSVFANTRAQLDAENRAANSIAEAIKLRVAAYLSGNA